MKKATFAVAALSMVLAGSMLFGQDKQARRRGRRRQGQGRFRIELLGVPQLG